VNKLAVYGTLKAGHHNHWRIENGVYKYLGATWLEDLAIKDEGQYPSLFRFPGKRAYCEVYEVDDKILEQCDILEGVKHGWYLRDTVATRYGNVFVYTRTHAVLDSEKDFWYPDGIWDKDAYRTRWLGWEEETKILVKLQPHAARQAAAEKRASRPESGGTIILPEEMTPEEKEKYEYNASTDTYSPPPRQTGRCYKSVDEDGNVEYIPIAVRAEQNKKASEMVQDAITTNPKMPEVKQA